jgi:hypothetical protein
MAGNAAPPTPKGFDEAEAGRMFVQLIERYTVALADAKKEPGSRYHFDRMMKARNRLSGAHFVLYGAGIEWPAIDEALKLLRNSSPAALCLWRQFTNE